MEAEGFEGISIADELRAEREGHEGEVYQDAEARAVGTADIKEWEEAAGKESREVGGGGFGEIQRLDLRSDAQEVECGDRAAAEGNLSRMISRTPPSR